MSEAPPDNAKDDNVRTNMQRIAVEVDNLIPVGWGFFVMVFPFGDAPGRMNYISNGKRPDILRLMKEFLLKNGINPDKYVTHVKDSDLYEALQESVKLQSAYAEMLNASDDGKRELFDSAAAWINRLKETGTVK